MSMVDREKQLEKALREELEVLWGELPDAIQRTLPNGRDLTDPASRWSIHALGIRDRIVEFSALVGATPWESINVRVLRSGLYERVMNDAGLSYPPIDWKRVEGTEQFIARGGMTDSTVKLDHSETPEEE